MSADERHEIEARLAALPEPNLTDPDNPPWTKEDFARGRGPDQMTDAELAAFPNTRRIGRPPKASPKVATNLRLDAEVVDYFKATGAGWQTRINAALQAFVRRERA